MPVQHRLPREQGRDAGGQVGREAALAAGPYPPLEWAHELLRLRSVAPGDPGMHPQRGRLGGAPRRGRSPPRGGSSWTTRPRPTSPSSTPAGFVEQAKKDSIDVLPEASAAKDGRTKAVVAVGCLAERYGEQLAAELPSRRRPGLRLLRRHVRPRLKAILAGERPAYHAPPWTDDGSCPCRRCSARTAPAAWRCRATATRPRPRVGPRGARAGRRHHRWPRARLRIPGDPGLPRRRPWAPLKIASGCDWRCAFCAIRMFRGARPFESWRPTAIVAESSPLAERGVKEVFSSARTPPPTARTSATSPARDALPELTAIEGIERVQASYLQPAEIRPGPARRHGQHARCGALLRPPPSSMPPRPCCAGCAASGARRRSDLLYEVRARVPEAGVRSNVIVGFLGETEADLDELEAFLVAARLDVGASSATPTRTAPRPRATGRRCQRRRHERARGSAP